MTQFAHIVFFSLHDASESAQQELLEACQQYLSGHPGTVYFSVGTLADKSREVNDREFQVALHVIFESEAAHDAYQDAERHNEFIARHNANWLKVRVFDSVLS